MKTIKQLLMNNSLFQKIKIAAAHPVLKVSLALCNLAALTMYLFVSILFSDYKIPVSEEIITFLKTMLTGSGIGLLFYALYVAIEFIDALLKKKISFNFPLQPVLACIFSVFIIISFFAL